MCKMCNRIYSKLKEDAIEDTVRIMDLSYKDVDRPIYTLNETGRQSRDETKYVFR